MPPSARPAAWPVLLAFLVAFTLVLAADSTLVASIGALRSTGSQASALAEASRYASSAAGVMVVAAVNAGLFVVTALATVRALGGPVIHRLRLGPSRASPLGVASATAGLLGLSLAGSCASQLAGVRAHGALEAVAHAFESQGPRTLVLSIFAIGLGPALGEETFFRGLMQTHVGTSWGRWPGIVTASAAFGLIHADPVQGPLAFALGCFLGWTVERFGTIRPAVVAHAANNVAFVALAAVPTRTAASHGPLLALALGGCLACAGSVAVMRTRVALRPAALAGG